MRTWKIEEIFRKLNQILVGYYHYYGITDNGGSLSRMKRKVEEMLFFWLNRRSQRRSYTWKQYRMLIKVFGLENPKIYVNIYGQLKFDDVLALQRAECGKAARSVL